MITPDRRVRLAAWICSAVPSKTTRTGSRSASSFVRAGFGASAEKIPSAPFVFSQANADGWMPGRRGELAEERRRPDERGAAVPGRDGTLRGRAIGGRHHVAPIVGPGDAEWKARRLHRAPDASARALLPEHDPLVLLVGRKLRVERLHQLLERAVDDRRVVRQGGHHPRRTVDGEPVQREGRLGPHRRRQVLDEARAELLVRLGQVAVEGRRPASSSAR